MSELLLRSLAGESSRVLHTRAHEAFGTYISLSVLAVLAHRQNICYSLRALDVTMISSAYCIVYAMI